MPESAGLPHEGFAADAELRLNSSRADPLGRMQQENTVALTSASWKSLYAPRSIAIVGATDRAGGLSFTGRFLAARRAIGDAGKLFFVNPTKTTLFDQPCYPDLSALPERVDAVAFSIPS